MIGISYRGLSYLVTLSQLVIFLLFMLPVATVKAQQRETITPLKVGDTIPDITMSKIIRHTVPSAKLSDFKEQLIILDFWDTYCGSCIELLPKMDSLQNVFGARVKFLPVTYQKEAEVLKFFKTRKYVNNVKLSGVVEDVLLQRYFPHKTISHLVWIYKGVVKAMTYSEYVNAANIQKILNGETINWPVKTDAVNFDYNKRLDTLNQSNPFLRGHIDGVQTKRGIEYDSLAKTTRVYFVNFDICSMYQGTLARIRPNSFVPHPMRRVFEVRDPSKYKYEMSKEPYATWSMQNSYCYERIFKKQLPDEGVDKNDWLLIVKDLDSLFGLRGRYEQGKTKCLVIVPSKTKPLTMPKIKRNKGMEMPMDGVVIFMDMTGKHLPVINESGSKEIFTIVADFNSLKEVKRELNSYGFDLIEAIREIDKLVLTAVK